MNRPRRLYRDLVAVVAKHQLTPGQFYDGLGVDVYSEDRPLTDDTMTGPIHRIADLTRAIRKGKCMATTQYFNKDVTDAVGGEEYNLEVGTTNYAGEGPQMYLNFGGKGMILSHKDAKEFAEAVESIALYFQNWRE